MIEIVWDNKFKRVYKNWAWFNKVLKSGKNPLFFVGA